MIYIAEQDKILALRSLNFNERQTINNVAKSYIIIIASDIY